MKPPGTGAVYPQMGKGTQTKKKGRGRGWSCPGEKGNLGQNRQTPLDTQMPWTQVLQDETSFPGPQHILELHILLSTTHKHTGQFLLPVPQKSSYNGESQPALSSWPSPGVGQQLEVPVLELSSWGRPCPQGWTPPNFRAQEMPPRPRPPQFPTNP